MAERSVMAQIFVFGRVMNDLVPKESQSKQSYVCFDLMERTKNWTQFYQVWAWDADVTRLMQFKVKKGSMIWLAGSQRLVDVRMKDGKLEKKLKVSLNDFGFLPKQPAAANRQENVPACPTFIFFTPSLRQIWYLILFTTANEVHFSGLSKYNTSPSLKFIQLHQCARYRNGTGYGTIDSKINQLTFLHNINHPLTSYTARYESCQKTYNQ